MSANDEVQIIDTFNNKDTVDDFSVVVSYADIQSKNYSLSAGQYFEVKIEYVDITQEEFKEKIQSFSSNLDSLMNQSREFETKIKKKLAGLDYE